MTDKIVIRGAKEHNLKNIDIEIPRDKLVIFTGLTPEEWKRWWHKNYTWDDTEL